MRKSKEVRRDLKSILHAILIGFAIVAFWRGSWGLMDIYLFPNNYLLSSVSAVIFGILILYSTKNLINRLI